MMDPQSKDDGSVVEQENRANLHEEHVMAALDTIMQNPEQSYPQFVGNFTQLNNEDVNIPINLTLSSKESQHNQNIPLHEHATDTVSNAVPQSSTTNQGVPCNQDDALEEEMLEEGTRPPSVLLRETSLTGSSVQLDNFLDIDDSDSDDSVPLEEGEWIELGGYQASFSPRGQNNTSQEEHVPLAIQKRDSTGAIVLEEPGDDESNSSNTADVQPTSDLVFPGEIEDIPISPRENDIQHIRELDMSTTNKTSEDTKLCGSSQKQTQDIESDEVKPFVLDEDFDYDNVVLTPKICPVKYSPVTEVPVQ